MARAERLTRETRLLAATIAVSVVVLLVLGRFRFPDGADVGADPVQTQPLARLASRAAFDDLSLAITQLNARAGPSLVVLRLSSPAAAADDPHAPPPATSFVPAIRIRDDVALTHLPRGAQVEGAVGAPGAVSLVGVDPVRELALVRIPSQPAQVLTMRDGPAVVNTPGYVGMALASRSGVALQPLFVGRSDVQPDPRWDGPLVTLGPGSRTAAGAPIFTLDGRLAGLATSSDQGEDARLIPADQLMAAVQQIFDGTTTSTGDIGVVVQSLDARTAAFTGAPAGVVIAHVRPGGPSDDRLWVGDVVTAIHGQPMTSPEALAARVARTRPGTTLALTVLRAGSYESVPVVVGAATSGAETQQAATPASAAANDLGLAMRLVPSAGASIVRVRAGSAAEQGGLRPSDIITSVGRTRTPAPAQVTAAWEALDAGATLFVGVERDGQPRAVVLRK